MPLKLFKEIIQAKIASAESRRLFQKTTMSQLEDRLNWLGDEIDRAYDEIEKLWDAKEILLASISNAPHGNPTKKQRDKLNSIESSRLESLDRVKFYGNDYRDIIWLVFAVSNIRDYDQDEYLGEPEIEAIIAARRARERIAIKQDPSAVILAKRRGKRPLKLRETISRMTGHLADGTTTREELASMGEKRMAHVYEVSRDTARRARDAVLGRAVLGEFEKPSVAASGGQSEIVENTVVQLPTKKDQVISKG